MMDLRKPISKLSVYTGPETTESKMTMVEFEKLSGKNLRDWPIADLDPAASIVF